MGDISKRLSRHEFACKCGCGFDTVDAKLPLALEDAAEHFLTSKFVRVVIHINSGSRCLEHNRKQGAKDDSQHVFARACDFWMEGVLENGTRKKISDDKIADYLTDKYQGMWGIGRYTGRTHLDTRTFGPARWDKR